MAACPAPTRAQPSHNSGKLPHKGHPSNEFCLYDAQMKNVLKVFNRLKRTCIHRLQSSNPQGTRHTLKQASQDEAFERRLMKAIRLRTGWIKKDTGAGSEEHLTGEVGKAMLPWGKLAI